MTIDIELLRRKRTQRLREGMERFGFDALVVFEYANGRYAIDLRPLYAPNFLVRQAVVVTLQSPEVIVFVHQDDTPHRRQLMEWVPDANVRAFPTGVMLEGGGAQALAPIGDALAELGFTKGRLGTDIGTPASLQNLLALVPDSEVADANACLNWVRSVKFPEEVQLLREASSIVDEAMAVAVATAQPGVLECEILAEVMRTFYRRGAEVPQCNLIVCTGDNTAPMQRYAGERAVRDGDLVFMDIGACFSGVFSEATRTIVCGEPNARQRDIFRVVYEMHEAIIGAIAPGVTGEDLQRVAGDVLSTSPYEDKLQKMIIAHGIGVGYAEPPFISPPGRPTPPLVLEEGMILAVVPTIVVEGVPGGGGVRLEDLVAVTASGYEVLTQYPYDSALLRDIAGTGVLGPDTQRKA
ncbi:MAG: Xaa-Pro peptidase family protein [Microcella sp.]|uniref:Xaa-Pro peptidase family protein n=1 Tax=Microcella sp. TaxID=1913979 RepID=UPI003314D550